MSLQNIGINFGGEFVSTGVYPTATAQADLKFLRTYFSRIRIAMPDSTNSTNVATMRQAALDAKAAGFYVQYGVTNPSFSLRSANYSTFASAVMTEASWAQSNKIDALIVGNEEELHMQCPNSSLTSSGTTATFVASQAHNFTNGSTVNIINANIAAYNGSFVITVVNSTTFTYDMGTTAASPASGSSSGSIRATDITFSQMGSNIRALATNVKTVFTGTVLYSALQAPVSFQDYVTNGKGNLDQFAVNLYGNGGSTTDFESILSSLKTTFGSNLVLTEFGLNNNWSQVLGTDTEIAKRNYERIKLVQKYGVYSYFFTWKYGGNDFAAKFSGGANDGNYRQLWQYLKGERPIFSSIPNLYYSRANTTTRTTTLRSQVANRVSI